MRIPIDRHAIKRQQVVAQVPATDVQCRRPVGSGRDTRERLYPTKRVALPKRGDNAAYPGHVALQRAGILPGLPVCLDCGGERVHPGPVGLSLLVQDDRMAPDFIDDAAPGEQVLYTSQQR